MKSMKMTRLFLMVAMFLTLATVVLAEDAVLKPYILASNGPGAIAKKLPDIKASLTAQGFQVVGEYEPYKGAHVLAVTSDALKKAAARSEFGAYGAAVRVSLTEAGADLQVAYANPLYTAQAYRMKETLGDIAAAMERALGKKSEFGSKEGLRASALRKYHYMVMMPLFTDQVKLASYGSQDEALKAVEAGLAASKGGVSKVYRIDMADKKESVFGVALARGEGADAAIMKIIDTADIKHTAHLPYEIVVSDGSVYMLHGKFRIALDFPDLTMGTFMKISGAPSAIEESLGAATGK